MASSNNLYNTDYQRWAEQQRQLLLSGQLDQLDIQHLLEELGDVGKSNRNSLTSHCKTLLSHLLKYQHQTAHLNPDLPIPFNCAEWFGTILRCRRNIRDRLADSPSLKHLLPESLASLYDKARNEAAEELRPYLQKHQTLTADDFPDICPWTFDQIMREDWLP